MADQVQPLDPINKPSPSPSPQRQSTDILSLQKELEDKRHELNIAYQTSLELIDTNNDLQQQFEEQCATLEALDGTLVDYQMKIDLLERENQEYQQTINQTNDKYEELLGELAVTREHLNNAMNEISQYKTTIQSINHDIIHNTSDAQPVSSSKHDKNNSELALSEHINEYKDKLERQQKKYDELLREHEKYRNEREQLILLQYDFEDIKKEALKTEKRNKLLSDQIVDLTYSNVQLEKEINDYSMDIDEKNNTIQYLQNENQTLMTQKLNANKSLIENTPSEPNKLSIESKQRLYSSYGGPDSILGSFVKENSGNKEMDTLKRRLSVQLRDNFGYNSKLVMFANNIDENQQTEDCLSEQDVDEDANDLFTMVQSYENNEEYLLNAEQERDELDEIQEESLSELSDKQPAVKEEKEEKSRSPEKENPMANKSREEKPIDAKLRKSKTSSPAKSPRSQSRNARRTPYKSKKRSFQRVHRKTDALDEYLHLTASAVKINYPTVNATSQELIQMVRSMPFYQAHDHLNRYMMDRLRWEQIQQNKLLQLKAAAIQAQRDHERQRQSGVTKFIKKWFTTEYDDDVDQIVNRREPMHKGKVDLSAPLSKKENLRLNRVGKAKIRSTRSGGSSVNIGSLNPNGIAPKGTNRKKRVVKSAGKSLPRRHMNEDALNRRQKLRDQKLKTLSITQTLPSSRINDKNVQKMLEINAEYIDKVMQNEAQKQDKKRRKPTIRLTVPVKGAKEEPKIQNAEPHEAKAKPQKLSHPANDAKKPKRKPSGPRKDVRRQGPIKDAKQKRPRPRPKRKAQPHPQQKQGWFSWLSGTQPPPQQPQRERKRRQKPKAKIAKEQAFVADPYALAPNNNAISVNKAKEKDVKAAAKSKKPKVESEAVVQGDVNDNIKKVIDAQQKEEDNAEAKEEEEIPQDNDNTKAVGDAMDKEDRNDSEERKEPEQDLIAKQVEVEAKIEENQENVSPQEDVISPISPLSPDISAPSLITMGVMGSSIDDLAVQIEDQEEKEVDTTEKEDKPSIENEEDDPYNPDEFDISVMEARQTPVPEDRNSDSARVTLDIFSPSIEHDTQPTPPQTKREVDVQPQDIAPEEVIQNNMNDDTQPNVDVELQEDTQSEEVAQPIIQEEEVIESSENILPQPQAPPEVDEQPEDDEAEEVIESNLNDDHSDDLDDVLQPVFGDKDVQVNEEPDSKDIAQNMEQNE
eukprot:586339_1